MPRVCRRHALQRQPARVRLPRARGLRQQATARAEDNNNKESALEENPLDLAINDSKDDVVGDFLSFIREGGE